MKRKCNDPNLLEEYDFSRGVRGKYAKKRAEGANAVAIASDSQPSPEPVEFKPNMRECIARMQRFWNLDEPLDRVPAHVTLPAPPGKKADGTFFNRVEDYLRYREEAFRLQAASPDESLPVISPQYGHALISALCGSPIVSAADTVWSVPIIEDYAQAGELALHWENEWGRRFQADLARMLSWARGRAFVSNYEVEGVIDTMSALRNATRLMTDLLLQPQEVREYAVRVTDLLIEFGRWNDRCVARPQAALAGTATDWRIWVPPASIGFTADHSVMLSAEQYREHFLEHDIRLAGAFDKTLLEVHRQGNHQIANFGANPHVSLLTLEKFHNMNPSDKEAVCKLRGRKCFFIPTPAGKIEETLRLTGVRGVLLSIAVQDIREAHNVLGELERCTDLFRKR